MKIKYKLLSIIILLADTFTIGQITFSKSIIFPESEDYSSEVLEWDNHYYITSKSFCYSAAPFNNCFYVVKTNLNGEEIWSKKFEDLDTGILNPSYSILSILEDSTILIAAEIFTSDDIAQPHLINLTQEGDTIWTKFYYDTTYDVLWESKILPSGNLLNLAWEENTAQTSVHLSLRKITPNGDILWKKELLTDCNVDSPTNLVWVDDKHLLIGHYCQLGSGVAYPMVTKIDTLGNELWTEYYDDLTLGHQYIIRGMVQPLPNGGYAFPWPSPPDFFDYEATMLAFDSLHQPIWELQFPRIVNGPRTEIYYVNRAANGDLIWVGALSDHIETDLVPSIGRISPNGEMKWVRYYYHLDRPWDFLQQLYYITETSDGGLIATGLRYDIDINNPNPNYKEANIWLLKLDGEGCMTPGCTDETIYFQSDTAIVASNEIVKTNQTIFKIYPNPTSAETQIYFLSAASTKNKTLKIFSINGHLMQQEELDGSNQTVKVDLVGFPSGIYVVALEQDGQVLQRERLIKR